MKLCIQSLLLIPKMTIDASTIAGWNLTINARLGGRASIHAALCAGIVACVSIHGSILLGHNSQSMPVWTELRVSVHAVTCAWNGPRARG